MARLLLRPREGEEIRALPGPIGRMNRKSESTGKALARDRNAT
jgi:hypothetical protein